VPTSADINGVQHECPTCPKCGAFMVLNDGTMLLTNPPKIAHFWYCWGSHGEWHVLSPHIPGPIVPMDSSPRSREWAALNAAEAS
jgi:hypothetical protein